MLCLPAQIVPLLDRSVTSITFCNSHLMFITSGALITLVLWQMPCLEWILLPSVSSVIDFKKMASAQLNDPDFLVAQSSSLDLKAIYLYLLLMEQLSVTCLLESLTHLFQLSFVDTFLILCIPSLNPAYGLLDVSSLPNMYGPI